VTETEHETCKWDLLRCAENPDGWLDDLSASTRVWAADLPMEGLLAALRSCRDDAGWAGRASELRTVARRALLALACKDPDLLDAVAPELRALVPGGTAPSSATGRPQAPRSHPLAA